MTSAPETAPVPYMSVRDEDTAAGLAFAISAYVLWGFLPLYLKMLDHLPPVEVVAHRIIWSVPVAGALLIVLGRTRDVWSALRNPRMLGMAAVTAGLITINWGVYVWAIQAERALDAALGYYINPLFSMALGAVLLGERPSPLQLVAIGLAVLAVVVLTVAQGALPWPAVVLFVSFGFYAYCKKQLPIGPNQGFLLEVLVLLPFALVYALWLGPTGAFGGADTWLLLGCGVVTAIPLILYANGAKGLRLTTIAILQYIAPTMIFLCAVFIFDEPMGLARQIAFPLIWAALVLYSWTLLRGLRRARL